MAGGKIGGFLDKNQEESVSGREIRMDAKLADGSFLQDHVERQHRPLPLTSPSDNDRTRQVAPPPSRLS